MITKRVLFATLLVLVTLSGCAYRNNFPLSQAFPINATPDRIGVYVDANGTFYPAGWQASCPNQCAKFEKTPSLLIKAAADDEAAKAFRAKLLSDEKRQLALISDFAATHARLFILIHGFNTDEQDARESYDRIRDRMALNGGDGIIEFYWDGLVKLPSKKAFSLAPLAFWQQAAGNSQTAGSRGLRRIIALARNRDIFIISHSRGASVTLSALSNPPYADSFLTRTERLDFDHNDGVDGPFPLTSQAQWHRFAASLSMDGAPAHERHV